MPKHRANTGFGPTQLAVTNTTGVKASGWIPFGPFDADKFGTQIVFGAATSGAVAVIQALVSTASTSVSTLVSQTGNLTRAYAHSTYSSGVFSFVRLYSSAKGSTAVTSNTITAYFNALG